MNSLASHEPVHRHRKRTAEVLEKIEALSKLSKVSSADIAAGLRAETPGLQITASDVRNHVQTVKKQNYGLLTPHQQSLQRLQ